MEVLAGHCAAGGTPLEADLQRDARMALSQVQQLGRMVTTDAASEEEGQRRRCDEEDQEGREYHPPVRCNRRGSFWSKLIIAFIVFTAIGSGFHAGVLQHGQGEQHGDPAEAPEVHAIAGDGYKAESEGATEKTEQASQCPVKNRSKGEGPHQRRGEMGCMGQRSEGCTCKREMQARGTAIDLEEGAGRAQKGGREDPYEPRRGEHGRDGRGPGAGTGRLPRQQEDGKARRGGRSQSARDEEEIGKRVSGQAATAQGTSRTTMYAHADAEEVRDHRCGRGRPRDDSGSRGIREGTSELDRRSQPAESIWGPKSKTSDRNITIWKEAERAGLTRREVCYGAKDGTEDETTTGRSRGGPGGGTTSQRRRYINGEEDGGRDEAFGSGGLGALQTSQSPEWITEEIKVKFGNFLCGVFFDVAVFLVIVIFIVVIHRERRREAVRIKGRLYFRIEKRVQSKYNRKGLGLLLLVTLQHGTMAYELSTSARLADVAREDYEDGVALMQHVGQAGQGSGEEDTDGEDGGEDRPGGVLDIHTFCQGGGYSQFKWTGVGDLVNMIVEINNWVPSDVVAYHEVHHPPVQVLTSPRCRVYVLEMRADAALRLTSDEIYSVCTTSSFRIRISCRTYTRG